LEESLSQLKDHSTSATARLVRNGNPSPTLGCEESASCDGTLEVNAAEFVNPAQVVNQPATHQLSSHQLMDLTIGHQPLMDLSASQLIVGDQEEARVSSPLGSPDGLMCSTLGDFAAQDDSALFSLPLPLSSDMNS
jgi:hypothetical protein